jgi:hypothetical protein
MTITPNPGNAVRFEVENSGLTPVELAHTLPGPVERATGGTGTRGLMLDMLVAVIENASGTALAAGIAGVWAAWRRRREHELKDFASATLRVQTVRDDVTTDTFVTLHGDASESIRRLELELIELSDGGRLRSIRVTFPSDG